MPDITMCMSKDCSKKNECYRSIAKPDKYYQSYADYGKICLENDYKYFWETLSKERINQQIIFLVATKQGNYRVG